MMTLLSNLTFNAADPKEIRVRGIASMRQKLIDRIGDQISLARARETGDAFQRVRYRRTRDLENDEVTEKTVKTRVRPWWVQDKDGSILLWIKYGNQLLELQKGKPAIRIADRSDLIGTLETVCSAVRAGDLDKQIQEAVAGFRKRFGR